MQNVECLQATAKKDWFPEMWDNIGRSKNRIERTFKNLTKEQRTLLVAIADVDYYTELSLYTRDEKIRIGKAMRSVRELSAAFHYPITVNLFLKTDDKVTK